MMTILLLFIPLLLMDLYTPHIIRKTTVFGVFIPEPYIGDQQLFSFKKAYSIRILCVQIPLIILLCAIAALRPQLDQAFLLLGGTFLYLSISMGVYLSFHRQVASYKREQEWAQHIKVVRVSSFETKFEKEGRPFPHILFIPTFLMTVGLTIWLIILYPTLPAVIPTHWGLNGQADAWSDKSLFSVFSLTGILLFTQGLLYATSYGTFYSSGQLKAQDTARSYEREHEMRQHTVFFMALMNLLVTLLLAWLEIQSMLNISKDDHTLSIGFILPAFLGLFVLLMFWYMKRSKQINHQFKEEDSLESMPDDDQYWKWGLFYFNRENPDFFVEKKYGVGWTTNFAHPGIWIFLILVLGVPLIPLFFM